MYCRLAAFSLLAAAAAAGISCNRQTSKAEVSRFAILRFENLGDDPSIDWMGRAFSEVIGGELAGTRGVSAVSPMQLAVAMRQLGVVTVSAPGVSAGLDAALAAGANRIGYGDYSMTAGGLRARLWIEDEQTHKYSRVVEVSAAPDQIIGLATRLAQAVAPGASAYATDNIVVLRDYCGALEARNAAEATADLNAAIAVDGNFGPAYRLLADVQAPASRSRAEATLTKALQHASGLQPADRAQIEAELAALRGDGAGQEQALAHLAELDPKNSAQWHALAQLAMSRRDYPQAVQAYRHLLALQESAATLNEAAYAEVYGGELKTALSDLDKYRGLEPKDANALDSRGDINLLAGQLKAAEESYLAANQMNPNYQGAASAGGDLFKAAMARLMTGDVAGAEAIFQRYTAAREALKDPEVEFKSATWLRISGRSGQAAQQIEALAAASAQKKDRLAEGRAYAQLALWKLMDGDRAGAAGLAAKAVHTAGPAGGLQVAVAAFLSQPSAPAPAWGARADKAIRMPSQPALKDMILAYALLLDGKAAAAGVPLERALDTAGTTADEGISILLGWSQMEAGKKSEAEQSLRWNPIMPLTGPPPFLALYFPRIFALRAESATDPRDAQKNRDLFAKLAPAS